MIVICLKMNDPIFSVRLTCNCHMCQTTGSSFFPGFIHVQIMLGRSIALPMTCIPPRYH